MNMIVRRDKEKYMQDLKKWLIENSDSELEEMERFFEKRIDGYEEHMAVWEKAYCRFAGYLPRECKEILDLGCGTGLELDEIWKENPDVAVTGVDLCQSMLDKLLQKHSDKALNVICEDYFQYDFGTERWEAVISFESLHHFLPEQKEKLYGKICKSLKKEAVFVLGDYIACCNEEEELLRSVYLEKREKCMVPEDYFVHFDIPLTLEHELELLEKAGFSGIEAIDCTEEAVIIVAKK